MRKTTAAATSQSSRPRVTRRDGNGPNSVRERKRAAAFGRATEARFILDAQRHGLVVCRPFAEQSGYDCIVDHRGKLFRVQVKGTHLKCNTRWGTDLLYAHTKISRSFRKPRQFDVLALWIEEEGNWILLPRAAVPARSLSIYASSPCRAHLDDWEIFSR